MLTKELVAIWRRANPPSAPKRSERVSSKSAWPAEDFVLDTGVSGGETASCGLTSCPGIYLETAKRLVWSALVDPRGKRRPRPSTIANHARNVVHILRWLADSNVERLSDVDESLLEEWLDDLEDDVADGMFIARATVETPADARPSRAALFGRISAWKFLIEQSASLRESGHDALPAGFRLTVVPNAEAIRLSKRRTFGRTPSLPDEIAEAALDAAERILSEHAPDVIKALAHVHGPDGELLPDPEARLRSLKLDFLEATGTGYSEPSDHDDLMDADDLAIGLAGSATSRASGIHTSRVTRLMHAVRRVRNAGAVHLLGTAGQRVSELLSIDVTPPAPADDTRANAKADRGETVAGLPACVTRRPSHSGLYELFYVEGSVFKHRGGATFGDWLIGSRPIGETEHAPAVRTIIALERLLAPFRAKLGKTGGSNALFAVTAGPWLPRSETPVARLGRINLRKNLIRFYRDEIDWEKMPDLGRSGRDLRRYNSSRGGNIRTTQWRKLYVEYMMRADARLRPALYRQLHHVSVATLGSEYVSSDPSIIEGARDASSAELARLLVGILRGRKVAGRMADVIRGQMEEVRRLTNGLDGQEAEAEVQVWLRERQLGIYALGPAKCLVALIPQQALCHVVAGTATFRQTAPNYTTRTDERCERCPCALVDDEHLHFWVGRYVRHRGAVLRELAAVPAERHAQTLREFRAIAGRADYARAMLERFDHPIPADCTLL